MIRSPAQFLECVINISEGRDPALLAAIQRAGGELLLDTHSDVAHHRSVLTLGGPPAAVEDAARSVASTVVATLDLRGHRGVHPRFGVLDVVPWVSLEGWPVRNGDVAPAVAARDRFAVWAGEQLGLACFLYGPERSLPDVRRQAWRTLAPDRGPSRPHPTAGAVAVGARPVLIAYNLWLAVSDLPAARRIATTLRGPHVRALALPVGRSVQVSCNLIDPWTFGPEAAFDAVASQIAVERAELVGLAPATVVQSVPSRRWRELDLDPASTIEARLERAGLDGGRFAIHDD
jgi:glutamate formiminotransferase / 5-formyltetrahydrofolate cyclo-ligase